MNEMDSFTQKGKPITQQKKGTQLASVRIQTGLPHNHSWLPAAGLSNQTQLMWMDFGYTPDAPPVIQMFIDRVPTFFTYVFGKTDSRGRMGITCQGPHTVAHNYIIQIIDNQYWEDIFDEQIGPFTPQVIRKILKAEGFANFSNKDLYFYDYEKYYQQLLTWRIGGILEEIDNNKIPDNTVFYQTVRDYMIRIIEMHPYGSYGWNRSNREEITKGEIAGKGEGIIDYTKAEEKIGKIVDPHASFKDMEGYKEFLHRRVPLKDKEKAYKHIERIEIARQTAVQKETIKLIYSIRKIIKELPKKFQAFIWGCFNCGIEKTQRIINQRVKSSFDDRELGKLNEELKELVLMIRYYRMELRFIDYSYGILSDDTSDLYYRRIVFYPEVKLGELISDIIEYQTIKRFVSMEEPEIWNEDYTEDMGSSCDTEEGQSISPDFNEVCSLMDALNLAQYVYDITLKKEPEEIRKLVQCFLENKDDRPSAACELLKIRHPVFLKSDNVSQRIYTGNQNEKPLYILKRDGFYTVVYDGTLQAQTKWLATMSNANAPMLPEGASRPAARKSVSGPRRSRPAARKSVSGPRRSRAAARKSISGSRRSRAAAGRFVSGSRRSRVAARRSRSATETFALATDLSNSVAEMSESTVGVPMPAAGVSRPAPETTMPDLCGPRRPGGFPDQTRQTISEITSD